MTVSHSARFEVSAAEIPEYIKAIDDTFNGNDDFRRIVVVNISIMEPGHWFLHINAPTVRSFIAFIAELHMALPEKMETIGFVKNVEQNTANHQDELPETVTRYEVVPPQPVSDEEFPVEADWDEEAPEEEPQQAPYASGLSGEEKRVVLKKPKNFQKVSSGVTVEEDDDEE